jgi:hypothetical protein
MTANAPIDIKEDDNSDICGLCGEFGADKYAHPIYWPGELVPDGEFVHAECESEETGRAHGDFTRKVGAAGVDNFLRGIK